MAAAISLADQGYSVTIVEKNEQPGGRARQFSTEGFVFDMGPSWYWMPDVFDQFFARFGKKTSDYYNLIRLDPAYQIFFGPRDVMTLPAKREALDDLFEREEPGSKTNLDLFLREAAYKYLVGMNEFVQKPGHSILEFADWRVISSLFRLQMFQSLSSHVRKLFRSERLIKLLEFPVLFLGATPEKTPAMYSLMNYADLELGTWYPMGGMYRIVEAMTKLAEERGVKIILNQEVHRVDVVRKQITKVVTQDNTYTADVVVAGADYHHIEQKVLEPQYRRYSAEYWNNRTMAPSSLLFYLGVNKRLNGLLHHNLFFDEDFTLHAKEIYETPKWPDKPLFYVCAPSVTDPSVAPENCENLFILIPLAPDLRDSDEQREKYYHIVMDRLEKITGQNIREHVIYRRDYAHRDFQKDYHAFKGNAYGLANTLMQTAFLKPKMKSNKVSNLFFTGQLTTPGPGVPPSLISGQVVAAEIVKFFSH